MSKRMQVVLSPSAFAKVEGAYKRTIEGHPTVKLNYSDVIEEMINAAKINIFELRSRHTDLRRTLMDLAKRKDVSVEDIVSSLAEIKGGLSKKETKRLVKAEVVNKDEPKL